MGRDSIVFYKDWWGAIKELPEEKRLETITAIMDYAFAGVEPTDTMLRFATSQIRMFIDRDAKRYEDICEKRKAAIKKRWAKEKNSDNKASIQKNTNVYKCIQPNTPLYLNDNDNENGNVNGNVNENDNDNGEPLDKSKASSSSKADKRACAREEEGEDVDLNEKIANLKSNRRWRDAVAMRHHIVDSDIDRYLDEFVADVVASGWDVQKPQSFFMKWLGDELSERRSTSAKVSARDPKLGVGEFRKKTGERTYARSGVVVPEWAPPRPSEGHYWNEITGYWQNMI